MLATTDGRTDREDLEQLRDEVRQTAATFCDAVTDLEPLADRLVDLDTRLRAVEGRAGHAYRGPAVRTLAVDVLCGRLRGLRPDIAFVTVAAAERSEECLRDRGG
jgi:hypothetical protein